MDKHDEKALEIVGGASNNPSLETCFLTPIKIEIAKALREASPQWQPIETYDALKKKPKWAVFYVEESFNGRLPLHATTSKDRAMGNRKITRYIVLPSPPEDGQCTHDWFDPTNERVIANGHKICSKCGEIKEPANESND